MKFDVEAVAAQLDPLIEAVVEGTRVASGMGGGGEYFGGSDTEKRMLVTRMVAAIERLAPTGSAYREQARKILDETKYDSGRVLELAVATALRDDYAAGFLTTVERLIHADVFGDFLEMASELHRAKYKDAAAVIAGSVLEEHLRKLAAVHGCLLNRRDAQCPQTESTPSS